MTGTAPPPSRPDGGARHAGAVLVAAALWGTTGTAAHHAPAGSSQAVVGMATFGFGALILLAFDARAVVRLLGDRGARPRLIVGATGVVLYACLYYASMALVGVAVGNTLALGSGPVFAALLEAVVERRRPTRRWVVAAALAVTGLALLAASTDGESGGSLAVGVVLAVVAGLGYGLYSWSAAHLIGQDRGSRAVMAAVFTLAAVVLLPLAALLRPGPLMSPSGGILIAYLACVPMAFAYLLFGFGLRGLRASTATTLALFEPVVATGLAVAVLQEHLTVAGWAGLGLIAAGLVLTART